MWMNKCWMNNWISFIKSLIRWAYWMKVWIIQIKIWLCEFFERMIKTIEMAFGFILIRIRVYWMNNEYGLNNVTNRCEIFERIISTIKMGFEFILIRIRVL